MRIKEQTTIEEMRQSFAMVTMVVIEGEYKVDHILETEEGKETIHLKGADGSWIEEAQFDSETRRDVLDVAPYGLDGLDVIPCFMGADFPESLKVGDRIVCLSSKEHDDPWFVTAWVPEWVYVQHLERMKKRFAPWTI